MQNRNRGNFRASSERGNFRGIRARGGRGGVHNSADNRRRNVDFRNEMVVNIDEFYPKEQNRTFFKNNKKLILMISQAFDELKDSNMIVYLIRNAISNNDTYIEVLNDLFRKNQVLKHLNYFNHLMKTSTLSNRILIDNLADKLYFENEHIMHLILNYKTQSYNEIDNFNPSLSLSANECRRKIKSDNRNYYSYINVICPLAEKHKQDESCNICPYCHNEFELNYHPLEFKTRFCRESECDSFKCLNAHSQKNELRIIYNKNDPRIVRLTKAFEEQNLFCAKETQVLREELLPAEFNILTFKTQKCPYGENCLIDKKQCLNFHSFIDRKRKLSKNLELNPIPCQYAYVGKKWVDPKDCTNGDNCLLLHSKYELHYHNKFYKKKRCEKSSILSECPFSLICPCFHENEDKEESNETDYALKLLSSLQTQIDLLTNNIYEVNSQLFCHSCENCSNLVENFYNIVVKCKHFFCEKCLNLIKKQEVMNCYVCKEEFTEKSLIQVPVLHR